MVTEAVEVQALTAVIRKERVSVFGLPPSMLALMAPEDFGAREGRDGSCLRCVIAWGEACPAAVAERWGSPGLPWTFLDLLISTEYWFGLVGARSSHPGGDSVFRCLPGTVVFIQKLGVSGDFADGDVAEAGEGEIGELCIAGPNVTRLPFRVMFRCRETSIYDPGPKRGIVLFVS